jgi:hypothetical protein
MSAALQLPALWGASSPPHGWIVAPRLATETAGTMLETVEARTPITSLAFYRRHAERMLRRYLYASMQVGRAPSILGDPVGRGWASSRPIRTFEDAVIFVLDVESCLSQLSSLDRALLSRIVLQEYTQAETATLLGMSVRTVTYKFPQALDRLTETLLNAGLLILDQG